MDQPALPLDLVLGLTLIASTAILVVFACTMIWAVQKERRRPLPDVHAENVRRLANELRALANEVSALVAEEPAQPKEHAGVT